MIFRPIAPSRAAAARSVALVALLALAAPALAPAQTQPPARPAAAASRPPALAQADADYLREAAAALAAQLDLDKLGRDRGRGAAVRDLGRRSMEADQGASDKLVALAKARRVSLEFPSDVGAEEVKRIGALQNVAFDRAFVDAHLAGQKRMVALHEKAANATRDPDVKRFAVETLQGLRPRVAVSEAMARAERAPLATTIPTRSTTDPQANVSPQSPNSAGPLTYAPPPPPSPEPVPYSGQPARTQPGFEDFYRGTRNVFGPRDPDRPIQ